MDTAVHGVFVACLVGGFVATVLFALLGSLAGHGAGHLHAGHLHAGHLHAGHLHAGHGHMGHAGHLPSHAQTAHAHGHAAHDGSHGTGHAHGAGDASSVAGRLVSAAGWALSWLSPLTLAAGALWFGAAGLVAEGLLPSGPLAVAILLGVAIIAALLGVALVRAAMGAFVRASVAPLRAGADGAIGALSAPIRPDAAGEVIYTLEGLRRSAAARSVDGVPLPRGAHVVIVRRERGVALVAPLDPLAALGEPVGIPATTGETQDAHHRGDLHPPPQAP